MKSNELTDLIDFIKKELPSEVFACIVSKYHDKRFKVVQDDFIISSCKKTGFRRVIRDVKMIAFPLIRGEVNSFRAIYRYAVESNEDFYWSTKQIFE